MRRQTSWRSIAALLALAVVLPFAACTSDNGTTGPVFENPSTLRVQNNLFGPVIFLYARACGTTDWGEDLLDPVDPIEGTIQPGDSKEFTLEAGCYDLQARHLETTDPGPLITKETFDFVLSPVSVQTWTLQDLPMGPG